MGRSVLVGTASIVRTGRSGGWQEGAANLEISSRFMSYSSYSFSMKPEKSKDTGEKILELLEYLNKRLDEIMSKRRAKQRFSTNR